MSKREPREAPAEISNIPQEGVPDNPLIVLTLDQVHMDETTNLSRFAPNPKDIQELSTDIIRRGQLQPVVVRPYVNGDGPVEGKYQLVAGFQRFRAITMAKENGTDLPVLARVVAADDREALLDNLAENIKRKNQTPMDVAFAIRALAQAGLTQGEIGKEFGKSGSWISNHSKFIELRPLVQKQIHTGEIPFTVARTLPGMTDEEQDDLLARVKEAQQSGGNVQDVATSTRQEKKGKSKKGRKSKNEQTTVKGISAKEALGQFERLTLEIKELEKPGKSQLAAVQLYGFLTKYLTGKLGAQALHNRVMELV